VFLMNPHWITQDELNHVYSLLDFIQASPSAYHAVQSVEGILNGQGFKELHFEEKWTLAPLGRYYVKKNETALIAFISGQDQPQNTGFHIVGAHTDSPSYRLKPSPEIPVEGRYLKLNVETYGGPILNTWLDRPLSVAGRVILQGESILKPRSVLVHSPSPILVIPNLAIHMNRKVNEGVELNKQKDLLPLLASLGEGLEKDGVLLKHLSELLHVPIEDILEFDLFLYEFESGSVIGLNQEFISCSRLDDLAMVHAGTWALSQVQGNHATAVLACFDHEEVGSTSKQGAASPLLAHVLERILLAQGKGREDYFQALARSFFISADMAHALHPNSGEKHDPVNKPVLNGGPVIKISANQSYTTDAESSVMFEGLCQLAKVPVQKFVNRSDERGGSTIGPISSTHLEIRSVDVGNPILGMHSVRELGGVKDHLAMSKVFLEFLGL
jgi:aspartyl aminopeptidase